MGSIRVVLDTNVLISGLAFPPSIPGQILLALARRFPILSPAEFWKQHKP